jgi:hypothetical protein
MRRSVIAVLFVLSGTALFWLAGSTVVSSMEANALDEEWPAGLGAASTVPARYPPTVENDAARVLRTFVIPETLRKELGDYVKQEIERPSIDVAPLPAATGAFLAVHATELDALEQALTTQPIVWESDFSKGTSAPLPDMRHVLEVQRLLLARALSRHSDPAAWNELHAAWTVGRTLLRRPELISVLVGLAMARNTNAIARTLPPPVPPWREEMLTTDFSRALIAGLQAESWSTTRAIRNHTFVDEDVKHDDAAPVKRVLDFVLTPYRRQAAAELLRAERAAAASLHAIRSCVVPDSAFAREMLARTSRTNVFFARALFPSLGNSWRRVGRFRLELEATTKLLQRDFTMHSGCPDGQWTYDGLELRFSKEFSSGEKVTEMPLHFRVGPPG